MCNKFITFLVLTFIVSFSYAQQYTPMTAAGYQYKRAKVDSTLHIPSFCGVPNLRNSTAINGALAMDTCANKLYQWTHAAGWSIISGAGGGGTLQSVTDSGNTTTNDIQLLNHARVILGDSGEVLLDNGSKLRMGAIDAQTGGSKGIALICAVGYEMKWEGGSLYIMNDQGFTVREVRYKFSSIPTATDDGSKGFYPGSRWVLDNGTLYTCTDSTSGAAVWQNTTYPSLNDVATVGNFYVNDNVDTLRLNSIDGNNKHPILWTNDQYGGQPTNILDFSYNSGFSDNVAKIKFGETSGLGTGYIEITDKQSIFKNELSTRTIIQNELSGSVTQTTHFPLMKGGIDTLATLDDIRNNAIDTSNRFVNNITRTLGKDSIIFFIGSTRYAIKDSVGTNPAPVGYYGAFQDNTSQTAASINTAYPVKLNTTDLTNGVSVVNDGSGNPTRITLANTGIYNIQFSLQLEKTGGSGNMIADIWVRKNGVDIPSTTGKVVLTGSANASPIVAAWNYVLDLAAGDYVQLMWATSNTNVEIVAAAATSPHPAIPSAILTVTQQSGIMAGTGITAINSLTGSAQTLVTGTDSTDFKIVSTGTTHKFNLPTASATNRGALSSANWTTFNSKLGASDTVSLSNRINLKVNIADTSSMLTPYLRKIDTASLSNRINLKVNIADTATMLSKYLRKTDTASLSSRIDLRVKYTDTATMLTPYLRKIDTASLSSRIDLRVKYTDTSTMLTPYLRKIDTASLSSRINLKLNIADTSSMLSPYLRKIDTTNRFVNNISRTVGKDSIIFNIGSTRYAIKDSVGSGTSYTFSTGLTNSSGTVTSNLSTGVSGGQSVVGGTAASNSLTLSSTSNATKGKILFGTSAYDEVNNRLGIGTASPTDPFHIELPAVGANSYFKIKQTGTSFSTYLGNTYTNHYFWTSNIRYNGSAFVKDDATRGAWRQAQFCQTTDASSILAVSYWNIASNTESLAYQVFGDGNFTIGGTIATNTGYKLDVNGTTRLQGAVNYNPTNTAAGTTGNQTINKPSGTVNIAAAGTTVTVTNSLVSASSIVYAVIRTNDATATIKNVVPAAGSFVINLGASATAETSIGFFVIN